MTTEEFIRHRTFPAASFAEEEYVILDLDAESAVDMARSEEREKMVKWISVDERLPESYIEVCTLDSKGSIDVGFYEQNGAWKTRGSLRHIHVCYWLYLPALPTKNKEVKP